MSDQTNAVTTAQQANDSLRSPTFVIAAGLLLIAAGTIAAVFFKGDSATQNVISGTVIGTILGSITGFYYGSSKGSQAKDAVNAAKDATPTKTTVTGPPTIVTTTTGTP